MLAKLIAMTRLKSLLISSRNVLQQVAIANKYSQGTRRTFDASKYRQILRDQVPFTAEPRVILDVGCGEGTVTNFLREEFPKADRVIGVDISEEMISIAKKSYQGIEFTVGEMEKIALEDEQADFVFSRLAIHYSQDLTQTSKEIARVTKQGGFFFLKDTHPFFSTFLKSTLDYGKKEDVVFHTQCDDDIEVVHPTFTFEEYINTFTATGWNIISIQEQYGRGAINGRTGPYKVPTSVCFVLQKK